MNLAFVVGLEKLPLSVESTDAEEGEVDEEVAF